MPSAVPSVRSVPSFVRLASASSRLCCCFVVQYCTVGIPTRLTVTVWGSGVSFTTTSPNKVVYQKIILRNSYFWRWPVPSQLVKLILRGCEKGFSWMPYGFAQSYMYSITEVLASGWLATLSNSLGHSKPHLRPMSFDWSLYSMPKQDLRLYCSRH